MINPQYVMAYQPFDSPPDFSLCQQHYQSSLVPHQPSYKESCPCCNQPITYHRPSLCFRTKQTIFLGSQVPMLFYFMQIMLVLIVISFAVTTGQFVACGMANNQCKVLRVNFQLTDISISIPVGFTGVKNGVQYMFTVVIGTYLAIIIILEVRLNLRRLQLSSRKRGYSDYSVLLNNVSGTATKQQIADFVSDLRPHIHIVPENVTLVKKTRLFRKMMKDKRQISKQTYRAIHRNDREAVALLRQETDVLQKCISMFKAKQTDTSFRSGQVFVTFPTPEQKADFLGLYQQGICHRLLCKLMTGCSSTRLHGRHVSIKSAPPPNDIIWKNLEKPYFVTRIRRLASLFVSFVVVAFGATAAFGLKTFPSTFTIGLLIGGIIQVTNFLVVEFIDYSITTEHYWTHTQTKMCQVNRLTFFLFLNTTMLPFLVYVYSIKQGSSKQSTWNEMAFSVMFISLSNIFKPIILLANPSHFIAMFKRHKEKLKGNMSRLSQYEAQKLFTALEFEIHVIYSLLLSSFLSTFFFLPQLPALIIPQFIIIILIIVCSRYLLTRRCKTPSRYTGSLSDSVNLLFKCCVPLYYLGRVSFQVVGSDSLQMFWAEMFSNISGVLQLALVCLYIMIVIVIDVPLLISQKIYNSQGPSQAVPFDLNTTQDYNESNHSMRLLAFNESNPMPNQDQLRSAIEIEFNSPV